MLFSENGKTHKSTTYEKQVSLKNVALIKKTEEILEDPSKTVRLKRFSEKSPIQNVIFFSATALFHFFREVTFFLQTTIALRDFHAFKKKTPPRFSKKRAPAFFQKDSFC